MIPLFDFTEKNNIVYIDDILEEEILRMLGTKYSKKEKEDILFIFFMRLFIFYGYPNFKEIEKTPTNLISEFLHKELKLDDVFLFDNTKVQRISYSAGNCTENIVDNWRWDYLNQFVSIRGIICLEEQKSTISIMKLFLNKYYEETQRLLKKYPKKTLFRKEKAIYLMLNILEKDFNFSIKQTVQNPRISYKMFSDKKEVNDYYKKCAILFDNNNTYDLEIDIETYLANHYKEVFPFIDNITRQYVIKDNIIDIFGFSGNEIYIIEIKNTKKPKDLLFQLKNYRHQMSVFAPNKKINLISVTPELNEDYIRELKEINTEIYFFKKQNDKYIFSKYI